MKTPKKFLFLCTAIIFATALVSWKRLNYSATEWNASRSSYLHEKKFQDLTDAEVNALIEEDDGFSPEPGKAVPPAEDVLIQKIPGDNSHLLIMAFYAKENYSGPSFSLENGGHLVFRDDGNGYDKKAGDGLYTARVAVDQNEFRQKAMSITSQMKKTGYKPMRFDHRALIVDPDADEGFNMQQWDKRETVSISGLTNALGDLDIPDGSVLSSGSTNTVLSNNSASTVSIDAAALATIRTHCVTITNLGVVEDPTRTWNSCTQQGNINGAWTFKTIMKELASKDPTHKATDAQVSDFVKNWLSNWASNRTVNGDVVAARTLVNSKILNPWLSKSQNAGAPAGQLDMRFAPFKLLAIVNRFDLRAGGLHGISSGPGSAVGEGRYVFGLINSTCTAALKMGVILEFGVNKPNTCDARKAWAQQWVNLRNLQVGGSQYNQALQNITDQYTLCGTSPTRANQSSLDQLRTNEQTLSSASPGIWEMREFVLDGGTGFLKQNTVAQNPADKYDAQVNNTDVQRIVDFVNQNAATIKGDAFTVPLTWQGSPFLGGAAKLIIPSTGQVAKPTGSILAPNPFHWDGTSSSTAPTFIKNDAARFNFSLNTCWGCHGGETQTGFTHIDPVFYGTEATMSGFVTGIAGTGGAIDFDNNPDNASMSVKDPALRPSGAPAIRSFNEIQRRARDLDAVVTTACGSVLSISSDLLFRPLNSVD